MTTTVVWQALAWPGLEHLRIHADGEGIDADGVVLAVDGRPIRLHYRLRCDRDWTARELTLEEADLGTSMSFRSDGAGHWTDGNGRAIDELAGCIDVDVAATPFTNTLPIRRLGLDVGASRDLRMLYVLVPEMTVSAADQRYTCLARDENGGIYRYESGSFQAELVVDADGLVIEYPGLWLRVPAALGAGSAA